jgi:xanthine dehydrogenase accessory factor
MNSFIGEWSAVLERDGEVAVATVVNGLGPRPRENGAQMLVEKSGAIFDTVGGGRLEADVMACAAGVLGGKASKLHHFSLTGDDVAKTDMICGGTGDVLVYYSDKKDLPALREILNLKVRDGWLLFPLEGKGGIGFASEEGVTAGDAEAAGRFLDTEKKKDIYIAQVNGKSFLAQWLETPGRLHILGAGHVSREIVKIAHIAGIACAVYDDRKEFANRERFPDAECVVVADMSRPPDIDLNKKDMIAIVTRGHVYDKSCLEWAVMTKAGYVGMIGSRRKVGMILEDMASRGYPADRLKEVNAPIGLDIGAKTPAEIAVSIVAQLIRFKRGMV